MKGNIMVLLCIVAAVTMTPFVFAQPNCPYELELWRVYESPNHEYTISDGYGDRTVKVEKIAQNKCPEWVGDPTGSEVGAVGSGSKMTTISLQSTSAFGQTDGTNGQCRINNSTKGGKESHWYPQQGLHVSTPGWQWQPQNIRISDVDMRGEGQDVINSLRKAALVFGYKGNTLINATWTFPPGSGLIQHSMQLQEKYLTQPQGQVAGPDPRVDPLVNNIGYGFTRLKDHHAYLRGVMTTYGDNGPVPYMECTDGSNENLCAASFSFDEPIDGFYILHALEWKSEVVLTSRISVGPMSFPCGCKCKRIDTVTRSITLPTAADNTKCTRKVITDDQYICDSAAGLWCETKSFDRYTITGPEAGGVWPCEKSTGEKATFLNIFDAPASNTPLPTPSPSKSSSPVPT